MKRNQQGFTIPELIVAIGLSLAMAFLVNALIKQGLWFVMKNVFIGIAGILILWALLGVGKFVHAKAAAAKAPGEDPVLHEMVERLGEDFSRLRTRVHNLEKNSLSRY